MKLIILLFMNGYYYWHTLPDHICSNFKWGLRIQPSSDDLIEALTFHSF
jgi:hypothetical protein